jgi:hypothetical protein
MEDYENGDNDMGYGTNDKFQEIKEEVIDGAVPPKGKSARSATTPTSKTLC